ncbi:hypothetical protein ATEG_09755 [Aspergillus terreus NIH2624]|uniref:DUF1524 domain-containing protein n=1 Tax=Aspergillus terreus (strain NIH 2624 / FGSC A1156) TaxID=341663 RepID=Q0C979_ASPTN|nr:uncharacterized protein ATEG_09755 [Aspergillus terreus NIH2624]EAU29946.1 hypothetical protein ATEG_09755 [Aspergillus terreus NIH2624]
MARFLPALLVLPLVGAIPAPAPMPMPTPPGIPSAATAQNQLAGLTVAAQGSSDGYDRDLFPHWDSQGNSCDTRDIVLIRDGTNVKQGSSCAVSGTWYSPYDGATWTDPSDVDIDHVVPLSNAWKVCPVSLEPSVADVYSPARRNGRLPSARSLPTT